eukprot:scaffold83758_cov97-Cyclotella_meneghiniana.AAC.1
MEVSLEWKCNQATLSGVPQILFDYRHAWNNKRFESSYGLLRLILTLDANVDVGVFYVRVLVILLPYGLFS